MNGNLTLGSLFDGSGGFPLGGIMSGITPVWASEIEPFPIRVTTKRLPFVKHYGDISAMDGGRIEPVDIITFGSPCQDMSVAGKRDGLDGSRSGLFYQAVRIIKEMRRATNGKYPRWIVWENVPGAFSSNKGEDFRCVLESICRIADETVSVPRCAKWQPAGRIVGGNYDVAWRVLDAQYWGVPQRRKRIYLVADFTDGRAGEVLFESEGLSGYSAESFRAWQRAAARSEIGSGAPGFGFDGYNGSVTEDKAATLGVNCGVSTGRNGVVEDSIAVENHAADSRVTLGEDGKVQTLTSRMGTGGGNVPMVLKIRSGCEGGGKGPLVQTDKSATLSCNNDQTLFAPCSWDGGQISPTLTKQNAGGNQRMPDKDNFNCILQPFGISAKDSNAMKSSNPHSGIYEADTSRTLDGNGGNPSCNQGGIAIVCVDQGAGKSSCSVSEDLAPTLACTHDGAPAVCVGEDSPIRKTVAIEGNGARPSHIGDGYAESDVSYTLNATEVHGVAYEEKPVFAMTTGSFPNVAEEKAPPVLARDFKDATVVTEPSFGIGRDAFNQGANAQFKPCIEEEIQPTIVAKGPGAVASSVGFYPQMKAECMTPTVEKATTLVNGTNPGYQNGVMENGYTVRRLTPTECARLQGFPDTWCSGLETPEPTMDDIAYWYEVWETHRRVTGSSAKPKNLKQIRRWLVDPYADASEYKMWGNGVALPCVFFVLSGIVYCTRNRPLETPE